MTALQVLMLISILSSISYGLRSYPNFKTLFSIPYSSHSLMENTSYVDANFYDWRNMAKTGLDMRYGPDLAEISPFYNSDGNVSIDKLQHIQLCQRIVKTLECDSRSIYTKLAILHYFSFLFPPGKEYLDFYSNSVTETRITEGGLLDDWEFDEFDISDFL